MSSITTSNTCTVVVYTKTSDTVYLWVRGNSNNAYYLSADNNGGGYYHGLCGSPTNYVDTVSSSYQPHDDVWHMLEAKNVDFSSWTQFEWFLYPSGWQLIGDVSLILVYNKNLSSTESSQNYDALKEINARTITSSASCWSFNGGSFGSSANNIYTYDETLGDMVYNCLNSWEKSQFQSHNKQSACDNDSNNFFHGAYTTGDPKIFFMKRRRNVNGSRAGIGHGRACISPGTTLVSNIRIW